MAKSKTGGSRAYIRGRIGSDVYSIGKDGKGKKQQVVRSLAESVANPQTQAQMVGRMIMSTIAQAASALRPIIDHSFDNVSGRQPNISEFTRLNYALIKADVEAHPSSGNEFGLVKYQEKGIKSGVYQVSKGDIAVPTAITFVDAAGSFQIVLASGATTIADLKAALGFTSAEGYVTFIGLSSLEPKCQYARLSVADTLSDETAISASNIGQVFNVEGNVEPGITFSSNTITIVLKNNAIPSCGGFVMSDKVQGTWKHSTCKLVKRSSSTLNYTAAVALPTYPQGENFYLNGGDL